MKAQYQILAELKRVDEKVLRLQQELERIPLEIAKLDKTLTTHREKYNQVKELADTAEKKQRKLESDLKEKEEGLRKAESKMMEVKTNQEYQAAMKENEGSKTEKASLEEQVLILLSAAEMARTQLNAAETEFKSTEATINKDKEEYEKEKSKLSAAFEEQSKKRTAVAQQLDKETLILYNRVALRARGTAIVFVENGMCCGCNMKIRPQLYNEVLGYKVVHRCPNCGRLLLSPSSEKSEIASTSDELAAK